MPDDARAWAPTDDEIEALGQVLASVRIALAYYADPELAEQLPDKGFAARRALLELDTYLARSNW